MKSEPLVSIVLPVYNAKNHIARCIQSVRAQTYGDLELIIVNDGSSDQVSLPVCEMFAKVDPRIVLVDKANAGVAAARNTGISLAKGRYLQFIDSDDYLDADFTATMVEKAERYQADMVISHYYMDIPAPRRQQGEAEKPEPKRRAAQSKAKPLGESEDEPVEIRVNGFLEEGPLDKNTFALHLMDKPAAFYYGVMWNKLYRTDLIQQNDIRCSSELVWSEDFLFNLQFIRYAERFYALTQPGYHYVQNPQSICHTKMNVSNIVQTKAMLFGYYKELYESLGLYEENKLAIYRYLVDVAESTQPTTPITKAIDRTVNAARSAWRERAQDREEDEALQPDEPI